MAKAKYDCPVKRYLDDGRQNPDYYAWLRANVFKYKLKDRRYYQEHKSKSILRDRIGRAAKLGMTISDYEKLWKEQKGLCAVCGQPERVKTKRHLAIDHNHKTEKIRGLLCTFCNIMLGWQNDDSTVFLRASNYLEGVY